MKHALKTPCRECPFRKKSAPGWLGDDTPENFLATTLADTEMPCHLTINYEKKNALSKKSLEKAEECAGARIFYANLCKLPRARERCEHKLQADRESVFTSPAEFLNRHNHKDAP